VRFFYLYPRAPQQSRDVPAVAGFLCDKDAVLRAVKQKTKKLYFYAISILKTEITALLCQQALKII